jgi:hypothetical protein
MAVPFTNFLWSVAAFLRCDNAIGFLSTVFFILEHAANGSPDPAPTLLQKIIKEEEKNIIHQMSDTISFSTIEIWFGIMLNQPHLLLFDKK